MGLCGTDKKKYVNRISRIEGQLRAIKRMVDSDRDCMDVLANLSRTRRHPFPWGGDFGRAHERMHCRGDTE